LTTRNNIHRLQLFHWIGRNIEEGNRHHLSKLTDFQREQYVTYLRNSLANGLWMTRPSERIITSVGSFTQELPAVCFTEWSLDRSLPHTTQYGRLGLGFPKRVVLLKGGQPVSYFKSTGAKRRYAETMVRLIRFFEEQDGNSTIVQKRTQDLRYLLAFSRAIREQIDPKRTVSHARIATGAKTKRAAKPAKRPIKIKDPFARKFGLPLDLAEEREWRIVFHPELLKSGTISKGPGTPPYYVPYLPGEELFTVALPDNRTVHRVLQDDHLCKQLFGEKRPHVTVVSLQDVGTF
jgi:Putative abortive phage resistance protein AbiGi, antitoxin